jgi:hypothetical protein
LVLAASSSGLLVDTPDAVVPFSYNNKDREILIGAEAFKAGSRHEIVYQYSFRHGLLQDWKLFELDPIPTRL